MNDTIGNAAPPEKAKRPRKTAERGLTPAQIKTLAYLHRVVIASAQAIQEANVSDRTPKTLEVLERDGYIRRVTVPGALLLDASAVSIQVFGLSRAGAEAVAALRGLVG